MSGLEAFGAVAAAIQLSTSFLVHLNTIRNAPKERRRLFEEVGSLMGILNDVRDALDQEEKQDAAIEADLKTSLADFNQRLKSMEEKLSKKSRLRDLGWPIEKSDVKESLEAIGRLKTTCTLVLEYSNRLLTKETNEKLRDVDAKIGPMVKNAAKVEKREILDWIWPPDFHHKQQDNRDKRHIGTGSAFLNNPKLLEWIEGPSNILACVGSAGVGKTLLVSILYDHLQEKYSSLDTAVVAVYLDFNQPDHQSWTALSANFVRQMAELGRGPSTDLIETYQSKYVNGLKPTGEDYAAFLMAQASSFSKVFVLVDALDEADERLRDLLLEKMADLQKLLPKVKVKFLSTSRCWHAIPNATRLDIDTDEDDMRKVLGKELEENDHWVRERSLSKDFIDDMLNTIVKAAQKRFLMIRLSLDALFESQTQREVRRVLKELPDTMDKAYDDMISRMQRDRNKSRAFETLPWLLYAFEPISANGVRHALAVDLKDKAFFEDDLVPEKVLLSSCKGLVAIGQQGGLLHFSHETVHDYLRKHEHKLFSNCHTNLAEKCLIYLSHGEVPHKLEGEGTSFFEYASRNWGSHVRMAGPDSHLSKMVDAFISDHTKLSRSIKCIDRLQSQDAYHAVHILAHFDLREIFENQIRIDRSRELFKDKYGRTTLYFAANVKSLDIVELLLSRDIVDVNLANNQGFTPLLIAIRQGYNEIAKAIIHHPRIDFERFDGRGSTALHEAVGRQNHEIARLLLNFGAYVNSRDFDLNRTPLFRACLKNDLKMANILMNYGADPDALDNNATRPSDEATDEKVRRMLRERSAIKHGPESLSALHKAVRDKDVDAVGRIIECGDHVTQMSFDGYGNTPLHYAAINNMDQIVSIMVTKGIDVNQVNQYGQTALDATVSRRAFHRAESETSCRIVEMLGWPIFRRDGALNFVHRIGPEFLRVPLHWAAEKGKLAQVELLLAWGSDPNRPDTFGDTPLHYAAANGHTEITKRLIPVAEVRKLGYRGFTPLRKARERNRAATVRLMFPFWTEADVLATDAQKKSFKDWAIELNFYDAQAREWVNLPSDMKELPVLD